MREKEKRGHPGPWPMPAWVRVLGAGWAPPNLAAALGLAWGGGKVHPIPYIRRGLWGGENTTRVHEPPPLAAPSTSLAAAL
jgi:hypothetical protein